MAGSLGLLLCDTYTGILTREQHHNRGGKSACQGLIPNATESEAASRLFHQGD